MLSALTARQLFSPTQAVQNPLVLIEDGFITEVTSRSAKEVPANARPIDFDDAVLVPGFMDIHIHGGGGRDVMEQSSAALPTVETFLTRHGVTSYFPTTVTAPLETILAALDRLGSEIEAAKKDRGQSDALRAHPLGIHLEGPFISHARRGVHPADCLLPPKLSTFERMWEASHGQIKIMTVAPELPGATELIAEATRRGICVSLGHSDAQLDAAFAGIVAGARHATHTFNAMRPLGHRDPGILALALADPRLSADIIADGIHVDPLVVDIFLRAKGPDRAVLITDGMAATGMPDGKYRLGAMDIEVSDGYCTSGGTIAGSVLTLDRAVRNVMQFANWSLQSAVQLATWNPARVVREQDRRGMLAAGKIADIVALSPAGEVRGTILNGRLLASS